MTILKLLEKVVYSRVYNFLEHHQILYESQFGFQSCHSCEYAISELTGQILQAKEQGHHSATIFLDLSKVFNTLNHQVLLAKLECYGLRGPILEWFKSYLRGRSLLAKVTTTKNTVTFSQSFNITYSTA